MKTKKSKYYRVVSGLIGNEPNMYDFETFTSKKAAIEHWKKEYRDRKKGDGYDATWNKVPCMIQKVTETTVNYW